MSQLPLDQYVRELLDLIGLAEASLEADLEGRKGSIRVEGLELDQRELQEVVEALNHVVARYADRTKVPSAFFDINGYRAAREELIGKIAVAAAEKVRRTGSRVELPSMNSYERRLVHALIGDVEGVRSESVGMGKERRVTVQATDDAS